MRIAVLGTRGIPAKYGGFETFAEEVAVRLSRNGHQVTVYGRKAYYSKSERCAEFRGVKTVFLPAFRKRELETLTHTFVSFLHMVCKGRPEGVILCNIANGYIIPLLKLFGIKVLVNVDGMEWQRRKWNFLGRTFFRACVFLTVAFARKDLVADSRAIAGYYRERFRCDPIYISYGAPVISEEDIPEAQRLLAEMGVEPGEYILQITRMVPENNTHHLAAAFTRLDTNKKLLLVGGDAYATEYLRGIHAVRETDARILMPGTVYDKRTVNALLTHAFAYYHGNEVGGTNPALLQAMGAGAVILAVDTVYNREVLGDGGFYFQPKTDDVSEKLKWLMSRDRASLEMMRAEVRRRIALDYDWDDVTYRYENALRERIDPVR